MAVNPELNSQMDALVARCSKFSGWNLEWSLMKPGLLTIEDPKNRGKSCLIVALNTRGSGLREVYGRVRQWGISVEEQDLMIRVLQQSAT